MRKVLCVALALLLLATTAQAERPPQSRDKAKLVVTGTVKAITTRDEPFKGGGVCTHYTAEVVIDSVDKGEQVKARDTITLTWFYVTKRPARQVVGAFGHDYALKEKDKAKFWLMDRAPGVPKGVWAVIYNKDGVEKIDAPAKTEKNGVEKINAPAKTELEGLWEVKDFDLNNPSPQLLRLMHGLNVQIKKKRAGFLKVEGDKFFPLGNGKLLREAVGKLDTRTTPKTIDFTGTERFLKGTEFLSIYKLDGDELTLCVGDRTSRPTEFKANPGQVLIRYERTKANK
jgi:uncharacterized protein (TIGR03067 family)